MELRLEALAIGFTARLTRLSGNILPAEFPGVQVASRVREQQQFPAGDELQTASGNSRPDWRGCRYSAMRKKKGAQKSKLKVA